MRNTHRLACSSVAAALLLAACSSGNGSRGAGGAGSGVGPAGATGPVPASGGATATGGSLDDTGGTRATGGSTSADGGARSGGATGSGGTSAGSGGRATGGRTPGGGPGTGGAPGTGGRGSGGATSATGGTSRGGAGGSGGTGTGTAAQVSGDDFVADVKVAVHANTATVLVVTWTQVKAADQTLLEFTFAGAAMTSRAQAGAIGAHRDVALGVPEKTAVTVRVVSRLGGTDYKSKDYPGTTGALPSGLPKPTSVSYDAALASPERWLLGAVEDSPAGCADGVCYYMGVFWIYLMDRQGRIVWYWADPSSNSSHSFPRVARDGEYLVIDTGRGGATGVLKLTLDRQYYEKVAIPNIDDAVDVTSDGSVLYDADRELREINRQGTIRTIWKCPFADCYCNAVTWVPEDDTVLMSFPDPCTVVRVDRKTGTLVAQYGNASGAYAFSPSSWKLRFQHSPTITPQGTFLVSTHLPDYPYGSAPGPAQHAFAEFAIDPATKTLTEKWAYREGREWPDAKGMALRLGNGNTLINYGTGGVIREVTPDKKIAFEVKFDVASSDDFFNKMVGNNVFVADLYALNGGSPK